MGRSTGRADLPLHGGQVLDVLTREAGGVTQRVMPDHHDVRSSLGYRDSTEMIDKTGRDPVSAAFL